MDPGARSDAELGMDDTRDGSGGGAEHQQGTHPSMRLVAIDHDEYDALADLFLGGGDLAPDSADESDEPDHRTHTPVLHLAGDDEPAGVETDGDGHGPIGVIESLEKTGEHASTLMAELLAEHGAIDPSDRVALVRMPEPKVELVVLGHLPVRATLWARQYACSSARHRDEVVGLVRAASGSTAIDLITGQDPIAAEGTAGLEGAIETLHERADRVMLRVDERHEPELLERPEVETITVLTGGDEAAVVASYRLVKTIEASLRERFEHHDLLKLRIAVMGATHEQGEDAREKLQNAVDSFIPHPVEVVIGAGRIDATGTTNIYRDSRAHSATRIIDGLVALAHPDEAPPAPRVQTRAVDLDSIHAKPLEHDGFDLDAQELAQASAAPRSTPAASACVGDGLCALIEGVRAIETRCPKAPGVEMGTDDDGRLHLLVCDADSRDALSRLYTAQSWARDHLGLLLRAEPGLRFPDSDPRAESDAVMHLISREPAALRSMYDTPVRMYALARVRVGGVVAQVATPLN